MGSTVEQDRSHLAQQVGYFGERGRFADETRSKGSTRQAGRNMAYTFPDEETHKFQEHTSINQNYWDQKLAAIERLPVFDDGENESLEAVVHSFVDKTSHLTTAVLSRSVEMHTQKKRYSHRTHRDLFELCDSLMTVMGECGDDTYKSRSVIKFCLCAHVDEFLLSDC